MKSGAHLLETGNCAFAMHRCFVFVAKPVAHYEGGTDFMIAKQMLGDIFFSLKAIGPIIYRIEIKEGYKEYIHSETKETATHFCQLNAESIFLFENKTKQSYLSYLILYPNGKLIPGF